MPTKEDWGGAEGDGRPAVQNEGFQKHSWLLHLELLDTSRGSAATLDSAQCGAEGLLTTACQAVVASQHLGRGGGRGSLPRGSPHCQIPFLESAPAFPVLLPSLTSRTVPAIAGRLTAHCLHEFTNHLPVFSWQGQGAQGGAGINNPIFCHPPPPHPSHHPGPRALAG